MDSEFLAYLSWREVLVAVVVLLVAYILFAFLRINRLRSEKRSETVSPSASRSAVEAYVSVQEPNAVTSAVPSAVADSSPPARGEAFAWNEPPDENPELRRIEVLEQDVAQLRREIGALRAEVQAAREEQRREFNTVQVTQNASPFYSDAMQMAVQGREAADISVLCGISRGEAELVVALARNRDQPLD